MWFTIAVPWRFLKSCAGRGRLAHDLHLGLGYAAVGYVKRPHDRPLPVANGAPLRVRVERQLGYKMAKYISRIELVSDFSRIGDGRGSYWADRGYEWFAGI